MHAASRCRNLHRMLTSAAWPALAAAFLFGVSTPLAKWLGGSVSPLLLAGLLYLGSGAGLACLLLLRNVGRSGSAPDDRTSGIPRADLKWLAGATVVGGMLGPALLMAGLATTGGRTGRAAAERRGRLHRADRLARLQGERRPAHRPRDARDRRRRGAADVVTRRGAPLERRDPDRRGLSVLGHRQQPDAQGRRQRCGADRLRERPGRRRRQHRARVVDRGTDAAGCIARRDAGRRLSRLRAQPGALRRRAARAGHRAHRSLFRGRAAVRRRHRARDLAGSAFASLLGRRRADGVRRLAPPARAACAPSHARCDRACALGIATTRITGMRTTSPGTASSRMRIRIGMRCSRMRTPTTPTSTTGIGIEPASSGAERAASQRSADRRKRARKQRLIS